MTESSERTLTSAPTRRPGGFEPIGYIASASFDVMLGVGSAAFAFMAPF
jgi:hypothetical protein